MSKWNYFIVTDVDGYAFPTTPQVNFGFNAQAFSFLNRGTGIMHYSFNGIDVHGDLNPADVSKGLTFDSRVECKVWFKMAEDETASAVRVEAWGGYGKS